MLKQEEYQDPFQDVFEDGVGDFAKYEKPKKIDYKSKAQKHKEKIQKLEHDINDPEQKKMRNLARRKAEKDKLNSIMDAMTKQQVAKFITQRKATKAENKKKTRQAVSTGQVFMLDLVFQHKMNGKQNKSLAKQIELIMKQMRYLERPPSIHLCHFQGFVKLQLQKMSYHYWPMTTHLQDIVEVGQKLGKKLVYLSPDAEMTLQKVQQNSAYILGGLIDRSILKNASLSRATQLGIQARRLPIRQFMRSRIVLNLDHVVLMVCKFAECGDWKTAFDYAAPKRYKRDAQDKQESDNKESEGDGEEIKQQ